MQPGTFARSARQQRRGSTRGGSLGRRCLPHLVWAAAAAVIFVFFLYLAERAASLWAFFCLASVFLIVAFPFCMLFIVFLIS
jgi:uncharacterized membrane protein